MIGCEGQAVRWRDDGTAPTASAGMELQPGQALIYDGPLGTIQFIQEAASAKLNVAFNQVAKDPDVQHRLADVGIATIGGSPDDLTKLTTSETARWRKVVTQAGLKPKK